jgi:UDP-N-acetylmuramate--alanine ligase
MDARNGPPFPPPTGDLVAGSRALLRRFGLADDRWLLVDALAQTLHLMAGDAPVAGWPVSTAAAGLDNRDGSGGTPPGLHVVDRRIGDGAAPGTVFESREPTGAVWTPGDPPVADDLILTRILTLDGREEGLNRGPGVDSLARYIYIHGTNHEDRIGDPVSHGCVRMTSADVVELFDRVGEGDPVVIA